MYGEMRVVKRAANNQSSWGHCLRSIGKHTFLDLFFMVNICRYEIFMFCNCGLFGITIFLLMRNQVFQHFKYEIYSSFSLFVSFCGFPFSLKCLLICVQGVGWKWMEELAQWRSCPENSNSTIPQLEQLASVLSWPGFDHENGTSLASKLWSEWCTCIACGELKRSRWVQSTELGLWFLSYWLFSWTEVKNFQRPQ